ncbi:MAG: MATE family efflux transporter [Halofilum sp. (in: g-proteobacteria)]|nr:MATE family efflux transporter [Halofilum sp. (in: g-proteobacteria)]
MTATRSDYRRAWQLAWPIILSNSSIPLVGAVDTAVMGHLPDPAFIGAVALGAGLFSILYWGFGFLRMGTTGFVAQALGSDDGAEARAALHRALLIACVLAAGLWILQWPIATVAFAFIEGSEQVEALTRTYFDWRIWSAPAVLANYAILGTLIGLQRTGFVLIIQLVLNGTNVALDLLFVPVLGMGVEGVALASVIAEYSAVAVGLLMVRQRLRTLPGIERTVHLREPGALRALFAVNGNIFVRTLCLVASLFYFTVVGTRLGETVVAANAILLQLQYFLAYGLDGFAHAAEGLAGSAWGARRADRFRAAIQSTTVCALVVALGYSLVYAVFGTVFIGWMTDIETVRSMAADYLPWMILAPLVSIWSFQLDGIFIGTTRTVEMRNGMLIATIGYLAAVALLVPLWHNHGLWLALMLFLGLRALTLALWLPRLHRQLAEVPVR